MNADPKPKKKPKKKNLCGIHLISLVPEILSNSPSTQIKLRQFEFKTSVNINFQVMLKTVDFPPHDIHIVADL